MYSNLLFLFYFARILWNANQIKIVHFISEIKAVHWLWGGGAWAGLGRAGNIWPNVPVLELVVSSQLSRRAPSHSPLHCNIQRNAEHILQKLSVSTTEGEVCLQPECDVWRVARDSLMTMSQPDQCLCYLQLGSPESRGI